MVQVFPARFAFSGRANALINLAGLAALAGLISAASVAYARAGGPTAAIWPLNALFLVFILRSPTRRWPAMLAAMFLGNALANMGGGDPPWRSMMFALANVAEVSVMSWALHRQGRVRLFRRSTVLRFMGWTPLAAAISTSMVSVFLAVGGEPLPLHVMAVWFSADVLGLLVFAPICWVLLDRHGRMDIRSGLVAMLPELLLVGLTSAVVFGQSRYPLLFLVPPVVVLVAFRRGTSGAALSMLIVGAIGLFLTLSGRGPTTLVSDGETVHLLVLQLFLATNALASLAVSATATENRVLIARLKHSRSSLADRSRNERLLIQQAGLAERMGRFGYWKVTPSTKEIFWSPQVYRIHGVSPETFNPSMGDALKFYLPEDRERVASTMRQCLEAKTGWTFEAGLQRADGTVIRVRAMAEVELDSHGQVATIFGVFKDITADHELLEKVREQEALYRLLANNSSDVIARFGLDSVFTYVSPSIKPLLGFSPEELVGRPTSLVIHPDDFQSVVSKWRRGLASSQPFSVEYRAIHRDGSVRWLEARPTVTRDEAGKVVEIVDTIRDVTERHEREEALAAATEAAQEATRAKAAFLSNMSHEIRTPLNGVLGFTDLLAGAGTDEERNRYIARIQGAGQALLHVVNDILDFSKIEAGKMTVEQVAYDPAHLSAEVVELVRAANSTAELVFTHSVSPDLSPAYLGDPGRVRQVLINIVGNAAKFTRKGTIEVRVERVEGELGFIVTDNGPGIAPDKLAQVFDGFTQADDSIARNFGGSGLGLSISRSLARLMEGDVLLESVVGQSTTATLIVPWHDCDPALMKSEAGAAPGQSATALRVMVVDDVEMNRELLEIGLRQAGHQVQSHPSAESALSALRQGADVDVILMDVQMPGMDGLTATRKIRKMRGPAATLPIIGLTANVLPEQVQTCRAAGMDDHVGKPVNMARLVERLNRLSAQDGPPPPAASDTDAEDAAINALKQRYATHLLTVQAQLRELTEHGCDALPGFAAVASLAHSIAGTAGSLGFGEVSDAAFQLEASSYRAETEGAEMDALTEEIAGLVDAIEAVSSQAIAA